MHSVKNPTKVSYGQKTKTIISLLKGRSTSLCTQKKKERIGCVTAGNIIVPFEEKMD